MEDLPLLMYGSGDVYPFSSSSSSSSSSSASTKTNQQEIKVKTDTNTTSLLAQLTVSFINDLVNAAVDSHDIFTDGKSGGGGGIILPHSSLSQSRRALVPDEDCSLSTTSDFQNQTGKKNGYKRARGTKRQFHSLESSINAVSSKNWEEELPMPIIHSEIGKHKRHADENWRGAVGLDLESNQIRAEYMTSTTTINEKSFLFPIYHDSEMFNRSKEILSFHDEALDAIFDQGIRQCIVDVEEKEKNKSLSLGGNASGGDDVVDGEERIKRQRSMPLVWPGFSAFLPTKSSGFRS